jgi:hypothetical protein
MHRRVHLGEDAPGVLEEDFARGQQAHAARRSLEEPGAELVLEREDVAAEWRLGQVQPARGATHVALFGHRDEGLNVREAHGE